MGHRPARGRRRSRRDGEAGLNITRLGGGLQRLRDHRACLATVALQKGDHAQVAFGAIYPAFVFQLGREFEDPLPGLPRGGDVPFKVDVSLGREASEPKPSI